MNLVIDAQIVAGLYREVVLEVSHCCTEAPALLFARLGLEDVAFIDTNDMIESEWRRVANDEWFDVWFGDLLAADRVRYVNATPCPALIKNLRSRCGFPSKSRDAWYIRTAWTLHNRDREDAVILSEDLDFFEPSAKAGAGNRDKILARGSGPMTKALAKEGVLVRTVAGHV